MPEVLPGSGNPRADGADRDAEVFGGLGVRLTNYLGEHEGFSPIGGKLPNERDEIAVIGRGVALVGVAGEERVDDSPALGGAYRIGADSSGDSEQP